MALRVGGAKKPFPPQEELEVSAEPVEEPMPEGEPYPEEEAMPEMVDEPVEEEMPAGGSLDPMIAGYKGPEQGPFTCGNCVHFGAHGDRTCAIVSGDIDEMGICNNFTTLSSEEELPDELMSEELPEEMPEEEVLEEEPVEEEMPTE